MRAGWVLWLAACGGGGGGGQPDAPSLGASHRFIIDHVVTPTSQSEARTYALDLDGDGTKDNHVGNAISFYLSLGYDVQPELNREIDTGAVIDLMDVQADDLANSATAGLATFEGTNPMPAPCVGASDTTCRHHLDGNGRFSAVPGDPATLAGSIASGELDGGPGHMTLFLSIFPLVGPIHLHVIGARAKLSGITSTSIPTGILAGGLSQSEVDGNVIPAIQAGAMVQVTHDCTPSGFPPACGCASTSNGRTLLSVFDSSPQDCMISLDEVRTNNLVVGSLSPDVMLDGEPAASLGLEISAVAAAF